MVALAATNRRRLTPQVEEGDASALRRLTRNAVLEIVAGIAVVAIVGALGVAIPAAHQSPVWPFSFTLSLAPVEESVRTRWILGACIATLCVIVLALAFATCPGEARWAAIRHRVRGRGHGSSPGRHRAPRKARVPDIVCGLAGQVHDAGHRPRRLPPMTPTACNAMACMGAAMALRQRRCRSSQPTLAEHAAHHRSGDLFWWIAHGIPNTPMPAFSPRLDDEELWTLVQYLRALSESRTAQALTIRVEPFLPITAPDFAFEESPHVQETLVRLRGHEVLLVVGVLPESLPRLRQIEAQRTDLAKRGDSGHPDGDKPRHLPGGRASNPGRAPARNRGFRHNENVCDVRMRGRDSLRIVHTAARRMAR